MILTVRIATIVAAGVLSALLGLVALGPPGVMLGALVTTILSIGETIAAHHRSAALQAEIDGLRDDQLTTGKVLGLMDFYR